MGLRVREDYKLGTHMKVKANMSRREDDTVQRRNGASVHIARRHSTKELRIRVTQDR